MRAARMDPSEWPEPKKFERHDPPSAEFTAQLDALRGECARMAKELQIAAPTLAPKAALEAIVRTQPRTVGEIMKNAGLLRWQAEQIRDAVESCLCLTTIASLNQSG